MNDKKQKIILSLIAIVTLFLVAIGAAYAFFASQNTGKKDVNINAESGTTDVLTFAITDEGNDGINITANMDNFASGLGNEEDSVTGTATLIANNATNNAHDNYYVYLNIAKNELRYTNFKNDAGEILEGKEEDGKIVAPDDDHTTKVPELILTVTQPGEDGELDHIDGLDYKTDVDGHGLNGFDITEATGLIPIAKNYEITATGSEPTVKATQEWEIKITLINLDSSQNNNTGKEFSGQLILQKDQIIANLADACGTTDTIGICVKNFSNADYEYSHVIYHNSESLANSNIINKELNANDNSYRYSGSSEAVKNFVCLDGTEATVGECTTDADLYRIIGFFPNDAGKYEMKLIKYDYATKDELGDKTTAEGGAYKGNYTSGNENYQGNIENYSNIGAYFWNYTGSGTYNNMWQNSNLNQINLNNFYYSYIIGKVSDLETHITEHKWTTGGLDYNGSYTPKQAYDKELGIEKLTTSDNKCYAEDNSVAQTCTDEDLTYPNQIGLMYLSDYGYTAYPEAWNQYVSNSSGYSSETVKTNNWMYMGLYEWTVSRDAKNGSSVWSVRTAGNAGNGSSVNGSCGVRPTFYLDSSTKIKSGNGTHDNPFRLSWN